MTADSTVGRIRANLTVRLPQALARGAPRRPFLLESPA
jgi:hypothetical protein